MIFADNPDAGTCKKSLTVDRHHTACLHLSKLDNTASAIPDPRQPLGHPRNHRTALPFAAAWAFMWLLLQVSYWLVLAAAVPTAGLLVRMFMIQHDCGHGSLFSNRKANDWTGRIIGILTFTPYDHWRRSHALHHASTGNLDRRGIGDIVRRRSPNTCGVAAGPPRVPAYRHPLVMFGLGPAYLFLLQNRLPAGDYQGGRMPWFSTLSTNIGIAAVAGALILLVGFKAFILIQLPLILMAASAGVWLFYVQHQFERTYWEHQGTWNHDAAALEEARSTICRSRSDGSPAISACITCIICRAGSRSSGCPRC